MHVRVLLFGVLKDLFPEGIESLEMPAGATVATLLDQLPNSRSTATGALGVARSWLRTSNEAGIDAATYGRR